MGLPEFLQALFEHGRVRVAAPGDSISNDDWAKVEAILAERHAADGAEFPGRNAAAARHIGRPG